MSQRMLVLVLFAVGVVSGGCNCNNSTGEPDASVSKDGSSPADAAGGFDATPGCNPEDAGVSQTNASNGRPPDGGLGKIQHLIIVVLENHTFDNLFANFPGAHSVSTFATPDGGTLTASQCPDSLPRDLCHEHSCALNDWDHGKMDGWFQEPTANIGGDYLAWCQYKQSQIQGFWDLASNYALADHFHASVLSPSFPGHLFTVAGQAGWAFDNPNVLIPWGCGAPSSTVPILQNGTCTVQNVEPCFNIRAAPDVLAPGLTWKFYGTSFFIYQPPIWSMLGAVSPIFNNGDAGVDLVPYAPNFDNDVTNGTLPNVSWLVDQDTNSGHPPFSMCSSVNWVTAHVNEVITGQQWMNTAILITWDDFGGFVDDVAPPSQYGCDCSQPYGLGFRLPLIIVSPWVKKGVFHGVTEHASIVRLVDELFSPSGQAGVLQAQDSAARDGTAGSLLDAFDFNQTPLPPVTATPTCP